MCFRTYFPGATSPFSVDVRRAKGSTNTLGIQRPESSLAQPGRVFAAHPPQPPCPFLLGMGSAPVLTPVNPPVDEGMVLPPRAGISLTCSWGFHRVEPSRHRPGLVLPAFTQEALGSSLQCEAFCACLSLEGWTPLRNKSGGHLYNDSWLLPVGPNDYKNNV